MTARDVIDYIVRQRELTFATRAHQKDFSSSVAMALARYGRRGLIQKVGTMPNGPRSLVVPSGMSLWLEEVFNLALAKMGIQVFKQRVYSLGELRRLERRSAPGQEIWLEGTPTTSDGPDDVEFLKRHFGKPASIQALKISSFCSDQAPSGGMDPCERE